MYEPNSEELQAVIISNDIVEMSAELNTLVNEPELGIEISGLDLFCQKTGHKIGTRNENSIFALVKICGKDVAGNLYNATTLNVHPAWIDTDEESLDALINSDPIGYACYCFSLITSQFYQTKKNESPKLGAWAERYWSLARANKILSERGTDNLEQLNEALARLITFMPISAQHLYEGKIHLSRETSYIFKHIREKIKSPDQLALLHVSGDLINILHNATNDCLDSLGRADAWIKRTRFIDIAATPEDAARGPSNVRRQNISKRKIEEASLFAELASLMKREGLDTQIKQENLVGSTAWRAKYMSAQQLRESELATELTALAEVTNLALPETMEDDSDDYKIETRIGGEGFVMEEKEIIEELAVATDMMFAAINTPETVILPPKPLTLLEKMRAKKGI